MSNMDGRIGGNHWLLIGILLVAVAMPVDGLQCVQCKSLAPVENDSMSEDPTRCVSVLPTASHCAFGLRYCLTVTQFIVNRTTGAESLRSVVRSCMSSHLGESCTVVESPEGELMRLCSINCDINGCNGLPVHAAASATTNAAGPRQLPLQLLVTALIAISN